MFLNTTAARPLATALMAASMVSVAMVVGVVVLQAMIGRR